MTFLATPAFALLLAMAPAEPDPACRIDPVALETAIASAETLVGTYLETISGLTDGAVPGTSVAVSACGRIVWREGFGWADIEQHTPVTPDSLFRAGSIAKTLTSALLGQAIDTGRLDPDAPIDTYLAERPNAPDYADRITTRQLAAHLAGIRHYAGSEFYSNTAYATVGDGLSVFTADPLDHEPGTQYLYSSYGWNLLSAVLEDAWPGPYLDLMQARVLDPAGMTDTRAEGLGAPVPGVVTFYEFDPSQNRIQRAPGVDNSVKWASGGFLSTPTDILRFSLHMHDGSLVPGDILAALTEEQVQADGQATGYGLGWNIALADDQLRYAQDFFPADMLGRIGDRLGAYRNYGHTGGSVGARSVYVVFPDAPGGLAVAAMTNANIGPVYAVPVANAFLDAIVDGD
jgi:serine beta-lactamase-like protein LACTB